MKLAFLVIVTALFVTAEEVISEELQEDDVGLRSTNVDSDEDNKMLKKLALMAHLGMLPGSMVQSLNIVAQAKLRSSLEPAYDMDQKRALGDLESTGGSSFIKQVLLQEMLMGAQQSPYSSYYSQYSSPHSSDQFYGSCAGFCGQQAGSCWCDSNCESTGDCCPDFHSVCMTTRFPEASYGQQQPFSSGQTQTHFAPTQTQSRGLTYGQQKPSVYLDPHKNFGPSQMKFQPSAVQQFKSPFPAQYSEVPLYSPAQQYSEVPLYSPAQQYNEVPLYPPAQQFKSPFPAQYPSKSWPSEVPFEPPASTVSVQQSKSSFSPQYADSFYSDPYVNFQPSDSYQYIDIAPAKVHTFPTTSKTPSWLSPQAPYFDTSQYAFPAQVTYPDGQYAYPAQVTYPDGHYAYPHDQAYGTYFPLAGGDASSEGIPPGFTQATKPPAIPVEDAATTQAPAEVDINHVN